MAIYKKNFKVILKVTVKPKNHRVKNKTIMI